MAAVAVTVAVLAVDDVNIMPLYGARIRFAFWFSKENINTINSIYNFVRCNEFKSSKDESRQTTGFLCPNFFKNHTHTLRVTEIIINSFLFMFKVFDGVHNAMHYLLKSP